MPITLGPNIAALRAQLGLRKSSDELARVHERLASGQRINRAGDDPAGLALAAGLKSDARIYTQAMRNVNDGVSLLNIAEGGVRVLSDIATRVKELATQAANGSYSSRQRAALDAEAQALAAEYDRIIEGTRFNGLTLLDGSLDWLSIQAGKDSAGVISFGIGNEMTRLVGDGTFAAAYSIPTGLLGDIIGATDLDGDGDVDLVLGAQGTEIGVLLGNGDGSFGARVPYASGNKAAGSTLTLGDLNGDGLVDLITQNSYADSISVLLGNGNGSFKAQSVYSVGDNPQDSSLGDLNGDGIQDLLVGGATETFVLLGNADGSFKAALTMILGASPRYSKLADINNDGRLDIVDPDNIGSLVVRLGNGNGTFTASSTYAAPQASNGAAIADINSDGYLDVVNHMQTGSLVGVFLGNGDGSFKALRSYASPTFVPRALLTLADFNGDDVLDLTYNDRDSNTLIVHLGNADGSFAAYTSYANATSEPRSMTVADVNGDDILDLISNDGNNNSLSILLGNSREVQTFPDVDLSSVVGAREAMEDMDDLLEGLGRELGNIGAQQSRLDIAGRHLASLRENTEAAASRILDADIAQETADMLRLQILQQSAAAIQAHALRSSKSLVELLLDPGG